MVFWILILQSGSFSASHSEASKIHFMKHTHFLDTRQVPGEYSTVRYFSCLSLFSFFHPQHSHCLLTSFNWRDCLTSVLDPHSSFPLLWIYAFSSFSSFCVIASIYTPLCNLVFRVRCSPDSEFCVHIF